MDHKRYKNVLNKVSALKDVTARDDFKFSNGLLFRDYQNRLRNWKRIWGYKGKDLFEIDKPFHNLFLNMSSTWSSILIPEDTVLQNLEELGYTAHMTAPGSYKAYFLFLYVNWELYKNTWEIQFRSRTLSHLYEPLYRIFLRGGHIDHDGSSFLIDGKEFSHKSRIFMLPSLEDDYLNYMEQVSEGTPAQNKVNALWDSFTDLYR